MRRLLMVSPHFPPDSSAGTHRVRLLAPYLEELGWRPTVLTVNEEDYEGRLDPELAGLVPPSVDVVRSRAIPAPLTRRLGVGDLGLRALPGLWRDARRLHAASAFDALFITIYPTYPALLGPMMKRRFGLPFVLDYQDPWVGAWGRTVGGGAGGAVDRKSRWSRALADRLERRVLRVADGVTAVSTRTYEDAFARTGVPAPRAVAEIPIGWDSGDIEAVRNRSAHPVLIPGDGRLNICYTGTLLPMGVAPLRAVLAAARAVIDCEPAFADRIRFHFFGTSNQTTDQTARVLPHARDLGLEHIVHEHPARLDYLDALDVLRQADALLLLGSSEAHYTPSKVFPLLLADRPIVAVCHRESTVVGMLQRAAPSPAARVFTFSDADRTVDDLRPCIADALMSLLRAPQWRVHINRAALEPWAARTLANRLASVCTQIAA
jgi:glycosyltransferase involved in cell wall biosynthesis